MKIVDERGKRLLRFGDLFAGDVFEICGDPAIKCVDDKAVVLTDGNYVDIEANTHVTIIDAEVVIS